MEWTEQVGQLGTFIVVLMVAVLYGVGKFILEPRRNKKNGPPEVTISDEACKRVVEAVITAAKAEFAEERERTKDLWDWHAPTDADGVKVWWVRRSLEEAVVRLATAIEQLDRRSEKEVNLLEALTQEMKGLVREIGKMVAAS